MNKPKIIIILIVSANLLSIFFIFFANKSVSSGQKVIIGKKIIAVDIADTLEKRAQGLSGRQSLAADYGMLFIFPNLNIPSFWMKDMNFPLDIIWLQDQVVVDLTKNLEIPSKAGIPSIKPIVPVNYVLEVQAGFISDNNVKVGDQVIYQR